MKANFTFADEVLTQLKIESRYSEKAFNEFIHSSIAKEYVKKARDLEEIEIPDAIIKKCFTQTISEIPKYERFDDEELNISEIKKEYIALQKSILKIHGLLNSHHLSMFLRSLEAISKSYFKDEMTKADTFIDDLNHCIENINLRTFAYKAAEIDKFFNKYRKELVWENRSELYTSAHKSEYGFSYIIATISMNIVKNEKKPISTAYWITNMIIDFINDSQSFIKHKLNTIPDLNYFNNLKNKKIYFS